MYSADKEHYKKYNDTSKKFAKDKIDSGEISISYKAANEMPTNMAIAKFCEESLKKHFTAIGLNDPITAI